MHGMIVKTVYSQWENNYIVLECFETTNFFYLPSGLLSKNLKQTIKKSRKIQEATNYC